MNELFKHPQVSVKTVTFASCLLTVMQWGLTVVQNDTHFYFTLHPSVVSAVLYGAMAVGEANTFAPNYAKAKMAASYLMMLINKKSSIDNLSEEGMSPVNTQRHAQRAKTSSARTLTRISSRLSLGKIRR